MQIIETEILYRPESAELRYLPEGPGFLDEASFSWVAIQHGPQSVVGSVNILHLDPLQNASFELHGRPGFAFPTDHPGVFVAGVEREVGLFDTRDRHWTAFVSDIDSGVQNTIINDGLLFENNLIFGCKDLEFRTQKAGLYLWRQADRALIRLRNDQICSNGKGVLRARGGALDLIDIDSPSKVITRSRLDIAQGSLGDPEILIDLTAEDLFPDGLILTPDQQSLIVALYDPGDAKFGAARQYRIGDGTLEAIWTCAGSPRVTCPQLIRHEARVRLVLTTAVEQMSTEQQARHPNAGCLFIGDTAFDSIGDQPRFAVAGAGISIS